MGDGESIALNYLIYTVVLKLERKGYYQILRMNSEGRDGLVETLKDSQNI